MMMTKKLPSLEPSPRAQFDRLRLAFQRLTSRKSIAVDPKATDFLSINIVRMDERTGNIFFLAGEENIMEITPTGTGGTLNE